MEAPASAAEKPPAAARRTGFWGRVRHHSGELFLTGPSFLWMVLFFAVPTALVFLLTFRPTLPDGGIDTTGWTLATWAGVAMPNYPAIVLRTVWLSFAATALCILISLPCAFAMARARAKWRSIMVGLVILPFWTSFLIRVLAWKVLMHPDGAVSTFLHRTWTVFGCSFRILEPQTTLLYNSVAVLVVMVYTYLPFAILPLYAAAEKFDFALLEAALDLGARPVRAFVHIFVPGVRAGIYSAIMMVLIPALGSYVIPDMVGGPDSEMIGSKIYQRAIPDRNLPHASALSALLMLGVLVPPGIAWLVFRRRHIGATETDVVRSIGSASNLGNLGGRRRKGGAA